MSNFQITKLTFALFSKKRNNKEWSRIKVRYPFNGFHSQMLSKFFIDFYGTFHLDVSDFQFHLFIHSFIHSFIHVYDKPNTLCFEDSPEEIRSFLKQHFDYIYDQSSKLSHISTNDTQNKRWLTSSKFTLKKYITFQFEK